MSAVAVDTKQVTNRRELHFDSLDDILAEADRLAAAQQVRLLGNWSLGQIMLHLAQAMVASIDGYNYNAPVHIRLIGRMLKNRFINQKMPAGFQLPGPLAKKMIAAPDTTTQDGIDSMHIAVNRLRMESQRIAHPVFGKLTREQYEKLHCRHAELHFSFAVPIE